MWERWDRVAVLDEPVGYLHRTAMNVFRDRRRRLVLGLKRVLRPPAAQDELEAVETRSVAADVLASLTPRQRAAIVLTEALGYSADEAGRILGIKGSTVRALTFQARSALKDQANMVEEGKADVLGLFMVTELMRRGELDSARMRDNYTTFIASIFRSIRFGATSAHGRANVARFNYFERMGAFSRDSATGTYRVDYGRMGAAMDSLSARLLTFQGDGDYEGVSAFMAEFGTISPTLQADLDRLATLRIPVDVVFEQGPAVLGLSNSE